MTSHRLVSALLFLISALAACRADFPRSFPSHAANEGRGPDAYAILARIDSLLDQARYAPALTAYRAAEKIYGDDNDVDGLMRARMGAGRALGKMGRYPAARDELESALNDAEQAHTVDARLLGELYSELGRIYVRQGYHDRAEIVLNRALEFSSGLDHLDPELEGKTLQALGLMHHLKGEYEAALDFYERSHQSFSRFRTVSPYWSSVPLNNIANILYRQGDYERALELHSSVLGVRRRALRPDHPEIAASLGNLGILFHARGNFERALRYHWRAISIWRRNFGDIHPELAASYHNVGESLIALGRYDEAIEMLELAVSLKESLLGAEHPRTAISYASLGEARLKTGDYEGAESMLLHAIAIWEANELYSVPQYWAALRFLGVTYAEAGRKEKSIQLLERARSAIGGHEHPVAAAVLNDLSELIDTRTLWPEKIRLLDAAIGANIPHYRSDTADLNPSIRAVRDDYELLRTLELKADVWTAIGRDSSAARTYMEKALHTLQRASDLVDRMRNDLGDSSELAPLSRRSAGLYTRAIRVALDLARLTGESRYRSEAFHFAEVSKNVRQSDLFEKGSASIDGRRSNRAPGRSHGLEADVLTVSTAPGVMAPGVTPGAARESLTNASVNQMTGTVGADELAGRILDERTTLLEYVLAPDSLYIFAVSRRGLSHVVVGLPHNLSARIDSLRTGITEAWAARYVRYAHELYELLIEPVEPFIESDHLVIVPDGMLSQIPFEALLTKTVSTPYKHIRFSRLPYLIRDRAVSYAYSATVLFTTATRARGEPEGDFIGIAPGFESGVEIGAATRRFLASNGLDTTGTDVAITGLPGSRQEIEQIRSLFAARAGTVGRFLYDRSTVLLGQDATEDAVYDAGLERFRYVHFATHGFANESDVHLSGLLLSPTFSQEGRDGILYADETYGLELNADLVVLSACETGIGPRSDGEGILGLSRGFLSAGARNLIVSLWPSDDFGTKYLMVAFYRHLLDGASIRDAMRAAKLELVAMGDVIAKPYYWSPFIQIGPG